MGVKGLTTYIEKNRELYFNPHKLRNTYLVVDGCSTCHKLLYKGKSDSVYGGDYDEMHKIYKDFFLMLKMCNVTPIVLIDGAKEKKKVKTILARRRQKLHMIKSNKDNFFSTYCEPPLISKVFNDVVNELGLLAAQCDLEADHEIATVAKALNCPVLSYDSDFFIYDVMYIPLTTVNLTAVKDDSGWYIQCSMYEVKNFIKEYDGLDKSLLPVAATLLGNDYIESSVFQKFFNHVLIPSSKRMSYTQRRIQGLLHWLKKETVETALILIISHIDNRNKQRVLKFLLEGVTNYSHNHVSMSVVEALKNVTNKTGSFLPGKPCEIDGLRVLRELFKEQHSLYILEIITLNTYFTMITFGDSNKNSCHIHSMDLIKAIYSLLKPCINLSLQDHLKVYIVMGDRYVPIKVEDKYRMHKHLSDILQESKESRKRLLYQMMEVSAEDEETISWFNPSWSLFILTVIYWCKKLGSSLKPAHVYALLLMAVSNQVVQREVGYYRNAPAFTKKKSSLMNKLKSEAAVEAEAADDDDADFDGLLTKVTTYERLLAQANLIPWRQTREGKPLDMPAVHLYYSFQICLQHVSILNDFLAYALPGLKVGDFFSGTLLFNLYMNLKNKSDFGEKLFENAPNVLRVFKRICQHLTPYFCKGELESKSKRSKKKKKKNLKTSSAPPPSEVEILENVDDDDDDEDDGFSDQNNMYAVLRKFAQI